MVAIKRRALLLLFLVVGVGGCILAAFWMLAAIIFAPNGQRAWHIAIALDQLGNATTGGREDETISSRAGRLRAENLLAGHPKEGRGWACVLCKLLDWLETDHCQKSIGT